MKLVFHVTLKFVVVLKFKSTKVFCIIMLRWGFCLFIHKHIWKVICGRYKVRKIDWFLLYSVIPNVINHKFNNFWNTVLFLVKSWRALSDFCAPSFLCLPFNLSLYALFKSGYSMSFFIEMSLLFCIIYKNLLIGSHYSNWTE